jgi:hypothetical protein
MSRVHLLALSAGLLCSSCTYGDPTAHARVQNVALSADGKYLAAVVSYERYQPATGLAAFPDGGVPRVLEQRADVYVVELGSRSIVFEGSVPAPKNRQVSFTPWLIGWNAHDVYFQITGCPGAPGSECFGSLMGKSIYSVRPGGRIEVSTATGDPVLLSKIQSSSNYVYAGTEAYGVSLSDKRGAKRVPFLKFHGEHLVLARH